MKHSIYTSYDELPLMLSVAEVAAVLGISRAGAYELVHGNEFPALKIGSRIVVPKDKYSSLAERDDAVESMRELAESGDVHAQYFMGKLYLDGSLVIPDSEAAIKWLRDDPIPIFTEAAICHWSLEKLFNLFVTVGFFHSVLRLKGLECYGSISLLIAPCQKRFESPDIAADRIGRQPRSPHRGNHRLCIALGEAG